MFPDALVFDSVSVDEVAQDVRTGTLYLSSARFITLPLDLSLFRSISVRLPSAPILYRALLWTQLTRIYDATIFLLP